MEILKFTLSGKTGFFKKPDVNSYYYYTYGNIHRVALMGILGAILGLKGYNSTALKKSISNKRGIIVPEFYSELKDIKISIVPRNEKGFISKKVQLFNNTVGYASKEQGGILNVKEQWLENPCWDIYLIIDNDITQKLKDMVMEGRSVYNIYLGKNDHIADISGAKCYREDDIKRVEGTKRINSLCLKKYSHIDLDNDDYDEDMFKYEEILPVALNESTLMYKAEGFVLTNMNIEYDDIESVIEVDNKILVFW